MTKISFIDSIFCAIRGLFKGIVEERNIKMQVLIFGFFIFLAIFLRISKIYLIIIIMIYFLGVVLELFNTTLERFIDTISPEYNKEFGRIKDLMAGIVFFTMIMIIIISLLIFFEPMINLLKNMSENLRLSSVIIMNIILILIIFIMLPSKRM